ALPQMPQALVAYRSRAARSTASRCAATPPASKASTTLPPRSVATWARACRSSAPSTTPSVNRKPAARSRSWPGVRSVTASGRPSTRISSGSSTATSSRASSPSGQGRTGRAVTSAPWGSWGPDAREGPGSAHRSTSSAIVTSTGPVDPAPSVPYPPCTISAARREFRMTRLDQWSDRIAQSQDPAERRALLAEVAGWRARHLGDIPATRAATLAISKLHRLLGDEEAAVREARSLVSLCHSSPVASEAEYEAAREWLAQLGERAPRLPGA